MSSHLETGVTWLWLAQQGGLAGTSVSVMKPLTAFVTKSRETSYGESLQPSSQLWEGRTWKKEGGRLLADHTHTEGYVTE